MITQKYGTLPKSIRRILLIAAIITTAFGIEHIFECLVFSDANIIFYLLTVLIAMWFIDSLAIGLFALVAATLAFNYFFIDPLFTFSVNDPNYIVTFVTATSSALVASTLISRTRQSALAARQREAEIKAIYDLANDLASAGDMHSIARYAVSGISSCLSCDAVCLCFDGDGIPERTSIQQILGGGQIRREVSDIQTIKQRAEELPAGFYAGDEFFDWPIHGEELTLGIIRIPRRRALVMDEAQLRLLRAMIKHIALTMDRFRAAEQRAKLREETVKERYRANLLRSVSHDIRTPLSAIIGTSEMLIDMTEPAEPYHVLACTIREDAAWLHSLVENILNLTRLRNEEYCLKKRPVAVEEVIGGAVSHIAQRSPKYEIAVSVPEELLLVPMDGRLITQVIINLLDNAVKHSAPENEISITAVLNRDTSMVEFSVKDRGSGISDEELPHIFEMFYTAGTRHAEARHGIGLGLVICETVVNAHGGRIEAHNRADGPGAVFSFTLPMEDAGNG